MQEQNSRREKSVLKTIFDFNLFYNAIFIILIAANREIFDRVYAVSSWLLVMIGLFLPDILKRLKVQVKRKHKILILIGVYVCWFLTRPAYTVNQAREQLLDQVGGGYYYLSHVRNGKSINYYYFHLNKKDDVYTYEVDPNTGTYRLIETLTLEEYFAK